MIQNNKIEFIWAVQVLKNPVNDASAMGAQLEKLGFKVIQKKKANVKLLSRKNLATKVREVLDQNKHMV